MVGGGWTTEGWWAVAFRMRFSAFLLHENTVQCIVQVCGLVAA